MKSHTVNPVVTGTMVREETAAMRRLRGRDAPPLEQSLVTPRTKLWCGVGAVAAAFALGCVLVIQDSSQPVGVSCFGWHSLALAALTFVSYFCT